MLNVFRIDLVLVNNINQTLMYIHINLYKSVILILYFPNIMKSIGFRMIHFLIRCTSLSRLALWTERTAIKVEMVGSNLTTCP